MANYLKINIQGKEVGLNFGAYTNQLITEKEGISLGEIFNCLIPKIMYYAYLSNCERYGTTPEFKMFDFFDLLDELTPNSEPFLQAQKCFILSVQGFLKDDKEVVKQTNEAVKEIEGKLKALETKKK